MGAVKEIHPMRCPRRGGGAISGHPENPFNPLSKIAKLAKRGQPHLPDWLQCTLVSMLNSKDAAVGGSEASPRRCVWAATLSERDIWSSRY